MGFGKKDKVEDTAKRAKDEKEQKDKKKDDEVDLSTGPITAATTSGFIVGM